MLQHKPRLEYVSRKYYYIQVRRVQLVGMIKYIKYNRYNTVNIARETWYKRVLNVKNVLYNLKLQFSELVVLVLLMLILPAVRNIIQFVQTHAQCARMLRKMEAERRRPHLYYCITDETTIKYTNPSTMMRNISASQRCCHFGMFGTTI